MMRPLRALAAALSALPAADAYAQAPTDSAIARLVAAELPRIMERLDVPGGAATVVRGDRVLLAAGFGLADRERGIPVSDSTVFRIASVAKVFTAIVALQAASEGRISLSQDIRPLVPDIPLGGAPLALTQLLTHTAGFDERTIGYLSTNTADSLDLGATLRHTMPPRGRPPAAIPAYSNHGYALAGLVIERVAGLPFDRLVRARVFEPLGMRSTAYVVPPMPPVASRLAAEYRSDGTRRVFSFSPTYPAGNIGTTARDMARLLPVLLHGDSHVVTPAQLQRLAGPVLTYHAKMPPMGLGFAAERIGGRMMWIKGGASRSHSAVIALIPDLDLALFVAVNRQEPLVWLQLLDALGDSIHKGMPPVATPPQAPAAGADISGTYRWTRAPLRSAEKVVGLFAQLRVESRGDTVRVTGPEMDGVWVARDSLYYESADGRPLAFGPGRDGMPDHVFSIVQGQPVAFERIPWHQTARAQAMAGLSGMLLVIVAGIAARRERWAHVVTSPKRLTMTVLPIVLVALIVSVVIVARDGDALAYGPTRAVQVAGALATAVAIVCVIYAPSAITLAADGRVAVVRRLVYVAGALGAIAILAVLASNNLIAARF